VAGGDQARHIGAWLCLSDCLLDRLPGRHLRRPGCGCVVGLSVAYELSAHGVGSYFI